MNLKLIRKYEKEFLHMLHGGTLLSRVMTSDEDNEMYTVWYEVNAFRDMEKWTSDYLFNLSDKECEYYKPQFIINDQYVEFRKAATEGKQLQSRDSRSYLCSPTKYSEWSDTTHTSFCLPVDCYRIKPEEPELKVGDWITVNGPAGTFTECISGINDDTYTLSGTNICYKSQATKWEPKKGEVCIFWDSVNTGAAISKFSHMTQKKYVTDLYTWRNCMPFTGVLPPHMKDNK